MHIPSAISTIEQYLLWSIAAPRLAVAILLILAGIQALLSHTPLRREQAHTVLQLLTQPRRKHRQ